MPATGQVTATAYSVEDAGGHVAYGETVNADLDTPGERGVWTFTGAVNDRVSVAINSSTVTACNSGSLTLLRPDGTTLATTTKICGGTVLTATLPTSGTYTFMVDPNGAITATVAVPRFTITRW